MTSHLAPPPVLRQRKSFTGLIERRARAEAAAAAVGQQPRIVSDLFFRFESPGAGSSRHPSVSPSKPRTGGDSEQRPAKVGHRLQDKIAELDFRARTAILEKNTLHDELTALQNESSEFLITTNASEHARGRLTSLPGRSAEREAALRVALERAEACIKGGTDQGQNSVVLQRKLEDLERLHADATRKHVMESEGLRRKLEQAQRTVMEQEGLILLQHQRATEKDTAMVSLEATVAKQEAELESLKVQLREAEIRQLAGRNAVDTLSHERRRHEATKAKLKALQATLNPESGRKPGDSSAAQTKLSVMEGNFSTLEHKYTELKSAARTLADEYEVQSAEVDAMCRLLTDLTAAYGRLASQHRVDNHTFEALKFEKNRLQLQLAALERLLAQREARLDDLEEMVEESRDARRIMEAALVDSEVEIDMLRERIEEDRSSQETREQDSYRLLNEFIEAFIQWEADEVSGERARAEGEIQSLRAINNTLEESLRNGDDLEKKLSKMEVRFTTLQVQSNAKAAAQHATLGELAPKRADLSEARSSLVVVQARPEQVEGRADVVRLAPVPEEEPERSRDEGGTGQITQPDPQPEASSSALQSPNDADWEQSHESLTREAATLLSQKSLAEGEVKRLRELNDAILGRAKSGQRSPYMR
ncbi:hypothetical protein FRC04_012292 [Tulasnella sp. 424]|nr:hypothetical protein FRC04_012292 [Tulasnella sp. 424]